MRHFAQSVESRMFSVSSFAIYVSLIVVPLDFCWIKGLATIPFNVGER